MYVDWRVPKKALRENIQKSTARKYPKKHCAKISSKALDKSTARKYPKKHCAKISKKALRENI